MEAAFTRVDDVIFREISLITKAIRQNPPGGQLRGGLESQRALERIARLCPVEAR